MVSNDIQYTRNIANVDDHALLFSVQAVAACATVSGILRSKIHGILTIRMVSRTAVFPVDFLSWHLHCRARISLPRH